jgi:hypothetical protein
VTKTEPGGTRFVASVSIVFGSMLGGPDGESSEVINQSGLALQRI